MRTPRVLAEGLQRRDLALVALAAVLGVAAVLVESLGLKALFGLLLSVTLVALVSSRHHRREQHRAADRRSEARYRALVDRSSDIMLVTTREGELTYLSPSAQRLLAGEGSHAEGLNLGELAEPDDVPALTKALRTASDRPTTVEVRLRDKSDGVRTYEVSVQDLTADDAIAGMLLTGHDITERRALQAEMEHRALHDSLTGLPNRALLAERFDDALREAAQNTTTVGLLVIDLDRFKEINDTLGHHYGDHLLIQVGARLTELLRDGDTVARLGGDEFAVLLPDVGAVETAAAVADRMQEALNLPYRVEQFDLDVEASIGLVLSGRHGSDAATLMQRADIAMYAAKRRGGGVMAYTHDINPHSRERLSLLGDLRRALEADEFFLRYQPKVSLISGQVCGAEALLRWQHPQRGVILPDDFVPLAENTGMIGRLTERVLDLAIGQAREWADAGEPLQVAVNLSARNLLDGVLDVKVTDLLAEHEMPAELLKLEVTESAIMLDPMRAKDVLDRLSAAGVALAIDDFGAGYTSLAQLRDLPVTELKVDRSFVTTMETDTSNALIVRTVIELGHTLGMTIVAEGVESESVLAALRKHSCDVAQGSHLSRPLAPDAFADWVSRWPGLPVRRGRGRQARLAG